MSGDDQPFIIDLGQADPQSPETPEELPSGSCRIAWQNKNNPSHNGGGEFIFSEEEAKRFAESANQAYPYIEHWADCEEGELLLSSVPNLNPAGRGKA